MAAPTAPTLITLTTEALKKAGYGTPTSAQLTRAQDYFMEEVKHDIWTHAKKLKFLQTEGVIYVTKGKSKYSMPTDFSSFVGDKAILMYGSNTGTLQAAAAGTLTLAATESHTEDWMQGKDIVVTDDNVYGQCTSWDNSTKVATLRENMASTPDGDEDYMIIDTHYPLTIGPHWDVFGESFPMNKGRPISLHPVGDADDGEFYLFQVPDDNYVVKINYYLDLLELDLAGTLMATLYKRWRNVWIQGVMAKQLQDDEDGDADNEMKTYHAMLQILGTREQYGDDLSTLQGTVSL